MRPIDGSALLKQLRKEQKECEKAGGEGDLIAIGLEDACQFVKEAPTINAGVWTSLADDPPPESGEYLAVYCFRRFWCVDILYYQKDKGEFTRRVPYSSACYKIDGVTHWQYKPDLPETQK